MNATKRTPPAARARATRRAGRWLMLLLAVVLTACGGSATPTLAPTAPAASGGAASTATAPAATKATTAASAPSPVAAGTPAGSTAAGATPDTAIKIAGPYSGEASSLNANGATFPQPLYSKWFDEYARLTGVKVNYQGNGSGAGKKAITDQTADFAGSDSFMTDQELAAAQAKCGAPVINFPTTLGAIVITYNVQGLEQTKIKLDGPTIAGIKPGQLRLNGQVLGDIYLGKINKWNDKAIADLNPGTPLPNQDIGVVRRADGSGTTFIFTNYLAKVNAEWKQKIGEGQAVQWPLGLGGKGNEGVAAFVQRLPGSIGYVEYAYAKQNKLAHALMQNAAGAFVGPDDATFKAAAAGADWSKSAFYEILTNQPGKESWPITGATFILLHRNADKPQQTAEVLKFFNWAYENGDKLALDLDYVPMPDNVVKLVRTAWSGTIKDTSGKSLWAAR